MWAAELGNHPATFEIETIQNDLLWLVAQSDLTSHSITKVVVATL